MHKRLLWIFVCLWAVSVFLQGNLAIAARMSDEDLAKKREGWYPTGLPLVNFSSDTGLGYGLRIFLYNNGSKSDPDFAYAPYFTQMYIQYFATTAGWQYHEFNIDQFKVFGTDFRVRTSVVFEKKLNANFFGHGAENAQRPLTFAGKEYEKYKDYQDEVLKANNYANYKYNNYTITAPKFSFDIYRNFEFLRFLLGYQVRRVEIDPWDNREFELGLFGGDTYRQTQPTLLSQLQPTGYEGGWTSFARLGVAIDMRDFEPDPKNGFYIDYAFEISRGFLGSEYDYVRSTVGLRGYISPIRNFMVAARVGYTDSSGDVPFYEKGIFAFAMNRYGGLGGFRTLRGYMEDRFIANTMTLGNIEARYQFGEINPFGQLFAFKIVLFCDTGNVYDNAKDPFTEPRFGDYKVAYGGGLVIAWNQNTIIHFYYGMSAEESAISINFNHSLE
ncbi:MAG: outer membrane protein assembly factor [Spirochaetes bacterium]|nr:outer membrane protein assembly factor [Spirochaetota bacterium]